jgi:uncharacterized protein (DUF58 family)
MEQRFLSPAVLAGISGLELVAKTVVDGFVAGLHRSPDFGFSQEFAEYRAYTPGDDLRHVDWNVFARTERMYLKRYRGETNTQLTTLLDTSRSMGYKSHEIDKLDYARYLAACVCYLAHSQRDAAGLIVFDDDVRNYVPPSTRQGQLHRLLHAIENSALGATTDYIKPFLHFQNLLHRRGILIVISDFYQPAESVIKVMEPLRYHGNDVGLFHVLDPQELRPQLKEPVMMVDMETGGKLEVSPEYAQYEYTEKIDRHVAEMRERAQAAGIDYFLARTDRALDAALREYLTIRRGRL